MTKAAGGGRRAREGTKELPNSAMSYAALEERVTNQGNALRALSDEMVTSFREIRADTNRLFGDLSAQIKQNNGDAATAYKGLEAKFDAASTRAAEAGRPQYLALFTAMIASIGITVTIVASLSSLHDKPVDDKLTSLQQLIGDLGKNTSQGFSDVTKATVSRSEYDMTNAFNQRLGDVRTAGRDMVRARMQADLDQLRHETETDISKIQEGLVPRQEHQFHWDAEAKIDSHLEDEIRNLTSRVDALAPAGDLLRTLTERQHELELQVYGRKPPAGSPPQG